MVIIPLSFSTGRFRRVLFSALRMEAAGSSKQTKISSRLYGVILQRIWLLYTLPSMQLSISFTLLVYFYNKEKSEHQLKLHTDGKGVQKLVLQSAKGRCNCDIRGESNLHVWWIWTTGMYPSKSALASEYYTEFVCRSQTGGRSVTQ